MPFDPEVFGKLCRPKWSKISRSQIANLAALHDICRRSGIKIEHHLRRAIDVFRQRQGRMQLQRRQIRQPDQRRQIVRQDVVNRSPVAFAPDRGSLHPIRLVHGRVLFEEWLAVHAIGIALASQRPACRCGRMAGAIRT